MPTSTHLLGKPLFGLTVLLLLGGLITGIVYRQLDANRDASTWVAHTYKVLGSIAELDQALSDAESSQRAFYSSKNPVFIDSFAKDVGDAERPGTALKRLEDLKDLTRDNPSQKSLLEDLEKRVRAKCDFMRDVLDKTQKGEALPKDFVSSNKGKILMDEVRAVMGKFRANEQQLLQDRTDHANLVSQRSGQLTMCLLVILMSVITGAFLTLQREFAQRRRVQVNLRAALDFQSAIVNNSLYAIIACTPEGIIHMFNPAAEKMLGYTAAEMIGKQTPVILHDMDEIVDRAAKLTQEFPEPVHPNIEVFTCVPLRDGVEEREWTYIQKSGKRITVLLSVSVLRGPKGEVAGFVGISKDITDRKQIDVMKNEFISTVSHELRTPLTSIRGALGLISGTMSDQIPADARQLITIAHKNSERLVRLVNNILDIEKIESGNILFENRPLDVNVITAHAREEMQGLADKSGVRLVLNILPKAAFVMGDEDRLVQILGNFISNAVKYSPQDGTVTISTEEIGHTIRFTVTDNGPGIPESFKSHIFEKFAQADSSDSRQKGGSGLGLSISKAIAESMRGVITFESKPGKTQFHATFPLTELAPAPIPDADFVERRKNRRILICEDDDDIAHLLRMGMEKDGFHCDIVHTAQGAKDLLAQHDYIAMTLDLGLPDKDGLALIEELRSDERTLRLPIIVISARADEKQLNVNGHALGVLGWLPKPIDMARLKRLLGGLRANTHVPQILYIEDEHDIIKFISVALAGVAHIHPAHTLLQAKQMLKDHHYDLAILDVMLPDGNGIDLLEDLNNRERPIPVIILSVKETPQEIQEHVVASMVKTVTQDKKIIDTIKSLIRRAES